MLVHHLQLNVWAKVQQPYSVQYTLVLLTDFIQTGLVSKYVNTDNCYLFSEQGVNSRTCEMFGLISDALF